MIVIRDEIGRSMSFAKRPILAEETAKPVAGSMKPAVEQVQSLLDDPDAVSPVGSILRLIGLLIVAFAVITLLALWMKPDAWWDDETSLAQPIYANVAPRHGQTGSVRLLFAAIV